MLLVGIPKSSVCTVVWCSVVFVCSGVATGRCVTKVATKRTNTKPTVTLNANSEDLGELYLAILIIGT